MKPGVLGRKVGMTQIFDAAGERIPVTVLKVEPNLITALKRIDRDGYTAVQLGIEPVKEKHLTRPMKAAFEKQGVAPRRFLREFRVSPEEIENYEVGGSIDVSIFEPGMRVDVTATTKGKGFQGVMRRHGMAGMRATHGTHEARRNPGSIGNRKSPGRTFKNKRLPGHMGQRQVTTQNVQVVEVDATEGVLLLKGAVPGSKNAVVRIRPAIKGQRPSRSE
ncbi:MAG: 50S ribosomal protein L3 [Deltaproteobacteria bacterium]|nr:MAG: 50S ribosomal protein L3 [Deltaproteobacteria bacterium]